jgi:hypothetical protein
MAAEARRSSTPGAPCWRKAVRRLGRCHHSDLRSRNECRPTGRALRSRTGRQLLHLWASQAQPGRFPLDRVSRAGFFEFFQGTSKLIVPDNPRTGVTRACRYGARSESHLSQPLEREPDSGSDRAPESAVVRKNSVTGHKTGHSHLNELCQGMA